MNYQKFPDARDSDNIFYVKTGRVNITFPENYCKTVVGSSYWICNSLGFLDWVAANGDYEAWCVAKLLSLGFSKHGMMRDNVNENFNNGQDKGNEDQQTKKLDIEAENLNATAANILSSFDLDNKTNCIALHDSKNGLIKIHLNVVLHCNPSSPGAKKPFVKYTVNEDRYVVRNYALIDLRNPPESGAQPPFVTD